MEAPVQMTSEPLSKERHMEAKEYLAYIVNEIHTTMCTLCNQALLTIYAPWRRSRVNGAFFCLVKDVAAYVLY